MRIEERKVYKIMNLDFLYWLNDSAAKVLQGMCHKLYDVQSLYFESPEEAAALIEIIFDQYFIDHPDYIADNFSQSDIPSTQLLKARDEIFSMLDSKPSYSNETYEFRLTGNKKITKDQYSVSQICDKEFRICYSFFDEIKIIVDGKEFTNSTSKVLYSSWFASEPANTTVRIIESTKFIGLL